MTIEAGELLERLSVTLRSQIGPAVEDEYTRTQAYMASVILAKVAKQVSLSPTHREAERADVQTLQRELPQHLANAPETVTSAVAEARSKGTIAALGPVIEAIYRWGTDAAEAAAALDLIRSALRNDIDRGMEIAR